MLIKKMPSFETITEFEKTIASFFGAPFAVSTDSCTHAIELCLRHDDITETACPNQTYISFPMTLKKLSIDWRFINDHWDSYYYLNNTRIIDAAVLWKN